MKGLYKIVVAIPISCFVALLVVAGVCASESVKSPTSDELTKEERSAQFTKLMDRRKQIVNQIFGEITCNVMPDAVGYEVGGVPQGFEVDSCTSFCVDQILACYLYDPDPEVRAAAMMALQWYLDEIPQLAKHIWAGTDDADQEVRFCAAAMLLKVDFNADDAPRVIALLDHQDNTVKKFALRAMGVWGRLDNQPPDMDLEQMLPAVPRLFELVEDQDSLVQHQATFVLRLLGPYIPDQLDRAVVLLTEGDLQQEKLATSILKGMGAQAISTLPLLVERMDADPWLREDGYIFQTWVANAILAIEPDLVDMVAWKIAHNLWHRGDQGSVETRLLCNLGPQASAAIELLKKYQVGEVNQVYLNATKALSFIAPDDPEVIVELLKVMHIASEYERYWIIDGLGRATTNFEMARPGLEWVLEADSSLDQDRAQAILDQHQNP